MPLYEYHCQRCSSDVEKLQQRYDSPAPQCCGKPMTKLVSKGSFLLKGEGWYRDGYQKGKGEGQ